MKLAKPFLTISKQTNSHYRHSSIYAVNVGTQKKRGSKNRLNRGYLVVLALDQKSPVFRFLSTNWDTIQLMKVVPKVRLTKYEGLDIQIHIVLAPWDMDRKAIHSLSHKYS